MRLHRRAMVALGAAALLGPGKTRAQGNRPVELCKLVLGFPPGSAIDALSRRVADKLVPAFAKAAVVENRVGGGGQVAVTSLKGAAADGSTVLVSPMSILGVYPHTYRKLPYDPLVDVTPVSQGATFDYGFAVGTGVPETVRTIPDFMAWCKANPGKASVGSPATGSTLHFTGVMLGRAAGVEVTHVGYRGSQAAIADLIGGQLPALVSPLGEFLRHLGGGKVRLLGSSGARRSRFTPQTATFVEQGYKDMAFSEWFGFYLPARAPDEVVARLNIALNEALLAPEMAELLAPFGLEPAPSSPATLAQTLKSDTARWGPIVKAVGFTADN